MFGLLRSVRRLTTKSFDQIPGPKSYPVIGCLHEYLITKKYSLDRLHWSGLKKYEEYGSIVKEEIVPGVELVFLFDPKDIKVMYQMEGKYPSRRSHLALEHWRLSNPDLYNSGGLLPTNGEEWYRMRTQAQKPLQTSSQLFASALEGAEKVADDFVEIIDPEMKGEDFLEELKKYFLEVTAVFVLGSRLGAIQRHLSPDSVAAKLMAAAFDTNSNILSTDNGLRLWRFFETKDYATIPQKSTIYC